MAVSVDLQKNLIIGNKKCAILPTMSNNNIGVLFTDHNISPAWLGAL